MFTDTSNVLNQFIAERFILSSNRRKGRRKAGKRKPRLADRGSLDIENLDADLTPAEKQKLFTLIPYHDPQGKTCTNRKYFVQVSGRC